MLNMYQLSIGRKSADKPHKVRLAMSVTDYLEAIKADIPQESIGVDLRHQVMGEFRHILEFQDKVRRVLCLLGEPELGGENAFVEFMNVAADYIALREPLDKIILHNVIDLRAENDATIQGLGQLCSKLAPQVVMSLTPTFKPAISGPQFKTFIAAFLLQRQDDGKAMDTESLENVFKLQIECENQDRFYQASVLLLEAQLQEQIESFATPGTRKKKKLG